MLQTWSATRRVGPVCLWAMLAGACASVPSQTGLMRTAELRAPAGELRATQHALAISIPGDIEATADDISRRTGDPAVRGQALLWKMEAIPAYYQTLFQADSLAGAIATLALAAQLENYLTTGDGRHRFGALQPIGVGAARKIRADVVNGMRLVARRPDDFDRLAARIDAWALENPIVGTSLASRPSIVPVLVKMAGPEDRELFGVIGDIGGSIADIGARLDIYSGYLPKAARWQSELLADELAVRDETSLVLSTLQSMTGLIGRIDGLTSPESIERATAVGIDSIRTQRIEAVAALDKMRADLQAYLTGERLAVLANVDSQTRTALAGIDRQRTLTLEQADELRRKTFAAADRMRSQTIADIDDLATRLILEATCAVAALLVLAALLAVVVRRTAAARPAAN
jgi:hypothetical protein